MDGSPPSDTPTADWPRISDYWPDAAPGSPQEPAGENTTGGPAPEPPFRLIGDPPPGRHRLRLAAGVTGAVVFLGVSGVVLSRMVDGADTARPLPPPAPADAGAAPATPSPPNAPVSVGPPPAGTTSPPVPPTGAAAPSVAPPAGPPVRPPARRPADPPAPPFAAGTFDLVSDITELHVTVGRPPSGVARVSTPPDSGITARATVDGSTVRVSAAPRGRSGPARVDVLLDARVAWTLRMTGGVSRGTFGLAGAAVRRIDLTGGAASLDLTLPRPSAGLPIRMSGGVRTWRIRTAGEVPVEVRVRRGAGEVALYGDRDRGVAQGTTVRSGGAGPGRLEIDAEAGLGSLTVTARP